MDRRSTLPVSWQRLLALMQRLNFGRIEQLQVRDGLPVFDGHLRVVREVKFGGDSGPRPELSRPDFALKAQTEDFFRHLAALRHATIHSLEVKHGLPFRMQVEEVIA